MSRGQGGFEGWTEERVKEHQRRHGFLPTASLPISESVTLGDLQKAVPKLRAAKQPNKTEQEFGRILQARIDRGELRGPLKFEPVKFRVGGNCYYIPDWGCEKEIEWMPNGAVLTAPIFFEVKGAHIWDDSKVKFKAVVELFPWATFEMWQKKGGCWTQIL